MFFLDGLDLGALGCWQYPTEILDYCWPANRVKSWGKWPSREWIVGRGCADTMVVAKSENGVNAPRGAISILHVDVPEGRRVFWGETP